MALIVQKYGGTSVGNPERIKNVAKRVAKFHAQGHQVVVVVSAMSGETNKLIALAKEVQASPNPRELDQICATGEQVTIGFKADEPVQVWTGKAGDEQNPYKKYEVKPWDLVKGLKAANEGFKAEKAAEREAAKEQGATLKGESEQMRESSAKLAGDNTPEEHANTR